MDSSRDHVWCDVPAFETALAQRRFADALALYQGRLLDGFFVSGAPGFERWVDEERVRLRQRAAEAAWSLADAAVEAGDPAGAKRWAGRAVALQPVDETEARRLMLLLHRIGDRAAALRSYEAFVHVLEREYDLAPSAETRALARALRDANRDAADSGDVAVALPEARPFAQLPGTQRRWLSRFVALAAGAVVVTTAVRFGDRERPARVRRCRRHGHAALPEAHGPARCDAGAAHGGRHAAVLLAGWCLVGLRDGQHDPPRVGRRRRSTRRTRSRRSRYGRELDDDAGDRLRDCRRAVARFRCRRCRAPTPPWPTPTSRPCSTPMSGSW